MVLEILNFKQKEINCISTRKTNIAFFISFGFILSTCLNCTFAMTYMLFPESKLKLYNSTCLNLQKALQI
jgi:hypothetical protein